MRTRILTAVVFAAAGLTWAHTATADTPCDRTDRAAFIALEDAVTTGQYDLDAKQYYRNLVRQAVQRDLVDCP